MAALKVVVRVLIGAGGACGVDGALRAIDFLLRWFRAGGAEEQCAGQKVARRSALRAARSSSIGGQYSRDGVR